MPDPTPAPPIADTPADPTITPPVATDPAVPPVADPPPPAAATWPEDWRKQMAGDDEKELKQAERYSTPKDIWKKARELERRLSSGELLKPLPDNATPEQVAEFRQSRGIPDKPEAYLEKLPNGLVIGTEDKPIFDSLVKKLHERNADPKTVHGIVEWYSNFKEEAAAEQRQQDVAFGQQTEDTLRTEWGTDYRINKSIRDTYIDALPPAIKDVFLNSRMPDGRPLGDHPDLSKWLVQQARDAGYSNTIVAGTNGNTGQTLEDEITKIEKFMGTNRSEYNKDVKLQQRLLELYDARLRVQKRSAA